MSPAETIVEIIGWAAVVLAILIGFALALGIVLRFADWLGRYDDD